MSHPLTVEEARWGRPLISLYTGRRACVSVERQSMRGPDLRIVVDGIYVLRPDAVVAELPERVKVRSPDGSEIVTPAKGRKFFITIESFDPRHLIVELPA